MQVLTNVGLEHTRWLGPTVADIAAEKLDVVQPGGTLVVGDGLHPDALALAARRPRARGARARAAGAPTAGVEVLARGAYQRRNFALALAAAQAFLGELDAEAVRAAAARDARARALRGRRRARRTTVLDGAHNPGGMAALAEALRGFARRPARSSPCVSVLDDKDAAGMLRELAAAVRRASSARPTPIRARCRPARSRRSRGQLGDPRRRAPSADPRPRSSGARGWPGPTASRSRPARST